MAARCRLHRASVDPCRRRNGARGVSEYSTRGIGVAPGRWARFEMRVLCFEPNSSEFNRHVPNSPAGSERDLESAQWAGWAGRATPRVCQRHTATRVSSRDVGRVSMSVGERLKGTIVSVRFVRSAHRHHLLTRTERHQITRRTSDASLHGSGPLPEDAREVHTHKQKRTCERNSSNNQQQWWRHQSTKLTRKRYTIPLSKSKAHQAGCGTRSDQK